MNSTLWTTLFAMLMAGAIVVMLTILVGLATDSATWTGRDHRVWLAKFQPFAWQCRGIKQAHALAKQHQGMAHVVELLAVRSTFIHVF